MISSRCDVQSVKEESGKKIFQKICLHMWIALFILALSPDCLSKHFLLCHVPTYYYSRKDCVQQHFPRHLSFDLCMFVLLEWNVDLLVIIIILVVNTVEKNVF